MAWRTENICLKRKVDRIGTHRSISPNSCFLATSESSEHKNSFSPTPFLWHSAVTAPNVLCPSGAPTPARCLSSWRVPWPPTSPWKPEADHGGPSAPHISYQLLRASLGFALSPGRSLPSVGGSSQAYVLPPCFSLVRFPLAFMIQNPRSGPAGGDPRQQGPRAKV